MNVQTRSMTRQINWNEANAIGGTEGRPIYVDRAPSMPLNLIPSAIQIDLTPVLEDEPESEIEVVSWYLILSEILAHSPSFTDAEATESGSGPIPFKF